MKKKLLVFIACACILSALIMELLPSGVAMNFAVRDGEESIVRMYPYFSDLPYGYANFSPLLIGILTCVCIILCAASFLRGIKRTWVRGLPIPVAVICSICVLLSFLQLVMRTDSFTPIGAVITVLMLAAAVCSYKSRADIDTPDAPQE